MNLQQEDLRVLVAELFNGGRFEDASGWFVQWKEVGGCKWLGWSTEGGLRVLAAELFNGGRSEGASGWAGRRKEV